MQHKRTLFIFLVLPLLMASCCSCPTDCIPANKMPYTLNDGGVKYTLVDHISINQMIMDDIIRNADSYSAALRRKFPDNRQLLDYLDKKDEVREKNHEATQDYFRNIQTELKTSGGELYDYRIVSKTTEEGWLILSKGKVLKKYITATDVSGRDY